MKKRFFLSLALSAMAGPALFAQKLKITDPAQLATAVGKGTSSGTEMALYACAVVMAIALVTILYKMAQGSNGAKEALIGWLAAALIYGLAVTYVLNTTT
jgi:hypothetical protein